jgi:hypothetical protein
MIDHGEVIQEEIFHWRKKVLQKSTKLGRLSKQAQTKLNSLLPEKAHTVITESIKKVVQATLVGSDFTTNPKDVSTLSLMEKEKLILEKLTIFKRTAAIEGAGTGAGGILLGLADFPLLLSIKMKFLFETASLYGFNMNEYEERLFLLYVFQLAFSSDDYRKQSLDIIENWEERKKDLVNVDWKIFQQEYRDHIDLIKMFQLIPGVGAIVGAYANYHLLEHLGETAMNCYRVRLLQL